MQRLIPVAFVAAGAPGAHRRDNGDAAMQCEIRRLQSSPDRSANDVACQRRPTDTSIQVASRSRKYWLERPPSRSECPVLAGGLLDARMVPPRPFTTQINQCCIPSVGALCNQRTVIGLVVRVAHSPILVDFQGGSPGPKVPARRRRRRRVGHQPRRDWRCL